MTGTLPPGREADGYDRAVAWGVLFTFVVACLVYAPGIPFPTSLQRHAAAAAGCLCVAIVGARAVAQRKLALPPLPLAVAGIAGALLFTAILPDAVFVGYSRGRALAVSGCAIGLVGIAAAARQIGRAHLGALALGSITAIGASIALIGVLETLGLDPLNAAAFYDATKNPVATFGNPDLTAEFLAVIAPVAAALACARGGWVRAAALAAAALCALHVNSLGIRFAQAALAAGTVAAAWLTWRRAAAADRGRASSTGRSVAVAAAVVLAASALGAGVLHRRYETPPAASAPAAKPLGEWPMPPTLEVRARVAIASVKLLLATGFFGTGAGNYSIAFARQRDPVEIEISTHRRADDAESIVDVAHNDPLQLVVETGALGLLALGALAAGLLRWRRAGLFHATANTAAAAAGLCALGVAALGHSPFYDLPATAVLGAILLGVVGAADGASRSDWEHRGARIAGLILLVAAPYPAWLALRACAADVQTAFERVDPQHGAPRLGVALELNPLDEHIPLIWARRLRNESNPAGALMAYTEALRRHPFLVEALLNRGVLFAELKQPLAARSDFELCRLLDARHPKLAYNRAVLEREQGNDAEAANLLDQNATAGGDANVLRQWGMAQAEAGALERAVPYLDRWVARRPDDGDAWYKLGSAFLKKNDRVSADLDFARAHRAFALEAMQKKDWTAALKSIRQYRNHAAPGDAGPALFEAAAELGRGNREAAETALQRAGERRETAPAAELRRAELADLARDAALGALAAKLANDADGSGAGR